jgi:tRNA-intron endonuclease
MRVVRGELTLGLVVVQPGDISFLWEAGYYGVSPKKDNRPRPLYGTLSLTEAYYLLSNPVEFEFVVHHHDTQCSAEHLLKVIQESGGNRALEQTRVYSDLRSRGWVVQSGLNYGTDFLLYRTSPESEHAPYAVVIRPDPCPEFVWRDAIALNRVTATAKKMLVIALINEDGSAIRYLHISRWVPEVERKSMEKGDSRTKMNKI